MCLFMYVIYAMSEICASDLVFSHSHTLFRANGCKINCSLDVNNAFSSPALQWRYDIVTCDRAHDIKQLVIQSAV